MGTVLLGMSLNFFHSVRVAHDLEVEAPVPVDARLPFYPCSRPFE